MHEKETKVFITYDSLVRLSHQGSRVFRRIEPSAECKLCLGHNISYSTGNMSTLFRQRDLDNQRCHRTVDSTSLLSADPRHNLVSRGNSVCQSTPGNARNRRTVWIALESVCRTPFESPCNNRDKSSQCPARAIHDHDTAVEAFGRRSHMPGASTPNRRSRETQSNRQSSRWCSFDSTDSDTSWCCSRSTRNTEVVRFHSDAECDSHWLVFLLGFRRDQAMPNTSMACQPYMRLVRWFPYSPRRMWCFRIAARFSDSIALSSPTPNRRLTPACDTDQSVSENARWSSGRLRCWKREKRIQFHRRLFLACVTKVKAFFLPV